jgi:hypothetical protein
MTCEGCGRNYGFDHPENFEDRFCHNCEPDFEAIKAALPVPAFEALMSIIRRRIEQAVDDKMSDHERYHRHERSEYYD